MFTFKEGRPQHYLYSVSIQYKEEEEMKEFSILLPKESLKGYTIVGINKLYGLHTLWSVQHMSRTCTPQSLSSGTG